MIVIKIQEIRIARDLERKVNKEQILEAYLGMLYFGNNAYGIDGVAQTYLILIYLRIIGLLPAIMI